ncbi:MAG TPA: type II toxin-antitoxin system death-on-curing family toxin [Terriglobia bacterium]|nr:type II toxin-antitoxin system death-on-curing family toxin [Terriglobia bacterium]
MKVYPSIEEVLLIHQRALRRFGGTSGIRDLGALESAIARPQSGYYNDVIEQAAALLESLSQNHPFLDGNKRTAISVTAAFLRVNGYRLEFEDHEAYHFLINLYEQNQFRFDALEKWLRNHARAVSHSD